MNQLFNQPKFFLVLVITAYFAFGLHHLTQFVTADEHYWVHERIPQYWDAVAEGKWKKTFINDKPGVTLALVSGVGYWLHPDTKEHCTEQNDKILHCNTGVTKTLYRDFRLPILFINGLLLLLIYYALSRATNAWVALWTTLLSALSPIILGLSQIVNPDSLLWSFSAGAVFSFLALLKTGEKKFLIFATLCTGFALLSKYTALILLPFFLAVILFRFLSTKEETALLGALFKKDLFSFLLIVAGSLALVCFFLPALLVDRKYLLEFLLVIPNKSLLASIGGSLFAALLLDTLVWKNKMLLFIRHLLSPLRKTLPFFGLFFAVLILGLVIARNFFPDWSIFAAIAFDLKDLSDARYYTDIPNFFEAFLLEWNPLVFSLTPITLMGFFLLLYTFFQTKNSQDRLIPVSLLFFFLAYTMVLIFSNVLSTPRYSIMLYPLFACLAALGIWHSSERFSSPLTKPLATLLLFVGSLSSLLFVSPFYMNYTNFLLPRTALISDSWGYGGYEAAAYLNALPDADHLTVWADYYGVCEFFVGKCLTAYSFDKEKIQPDYYVLTRRGQIRYMSRWERWEVKSGLIAYKYYAAPNPAWELLINDRPGNFVRVVKVEK